jgi:hypothetical protein
MSGRREDLSETTRLAPHGTRAAYMRHWRAGEPACPECKAAQAAASASHRHGEKAPAPQPRRRVTQAEREMRIARKYADRILASVNRREPDAEILLTEDAPL